MYEGKVYRTDGGDKLVVESGGSIEVKSGGTITTDDLVVTVPDDTTLEVSAGDELQIKKQGDINNLAAEADAAAIVTAFNALLAELRKANLIGGTGD